jgi:hypothetical protein
LSRLSCPCCPGCSYRAFGFPVLVVLPLFPCPSYPFLAVMFWPSCYLCIVRAEMPPRPVQTDLSQLRPGYPATGVCPCCPVLVSVLSYSGRSVLFSLPSIPAVVSCCHFKLSPALLYPSALSLLLCFDHSILPVLSYLSCPGYLYSYVFYVN